MSVDRTLKVRGGMLRARSVLTRAERIAQLTEQGKFDPDSDSPMGLPKVRVRRSKVGTKTKKAAAEEPAVVAEGAEGAEGAPADAAEQKPEAKQ